MISLQKGQGVNLSKDNPQLNRILIGLGWDARTTNGKDFDLDASAFLIGENGKVYQQPGIVGYMDGCESGGNGSVTYGGDNQTGEGEGDDETIEVLLDKVPSGINKIVIAVTIYDAISRRQNFGCIENSFVRVVNQDNDNVICKYDLQDEFDIETAMIMGELYRVGTEWKFRAVGQGFENGLLGLCNAFGVAAHA
ncbi:TerD family protein [Pseudoalteromonas sp. OFAV1]|jgi:tellurium resistance protein TerD|uniref:TerD family protein n=1 Tax=Pseudoalteromonas sp. OFAV1 TaxID=2908892 RepID=UPI001F40E1F8|nr:TerD family protein [Pseudoalteromonas sp. OFAV1]MCF2903196.1 TerD family protein [Pseudoalteromonas sp. OFAV1]